VLPNAEVEKTLKVWLSAAKSEHMLKLRWLRKPAIWMLTGQYILEDAKSLVISGSDWNIKLGISPATVAALTGVPVGGSLGLGHNCEIKGRMQMPGKCVWAAMYHLLDTNFVSLATGQSQSLPKCIQLWPDITSKGRLRKVDDSTKVNVIVAKDEVAGKGSTADHEDLVEKLEALALEDAPLQPGNYLDDLEDAIAKFEAALEESENDKDEGPDEEDYEEDEEVDGSLAEGKDED
jgi:hypothetical protein